MITLILNKKNLCYVAGFKGARTSNYMLDGVHFSNFGWIAATDGHKLGRIVEEFNAPEDMPKNGITLGIDKDTLSALKKQRCETVSIDIDGMIATIRADLQSYIVKVIDGNYPDIERVIPKGGAASGPGAISFNPYLLKDFMGYDKKERFTIEFSDNSTSGPIIVKNSACERFTGVLMPCRI